MKGLSLVEMLTNYSSPFQSHFNKSPRTYSIAFPSVSPFTKQEFKQEADINVIMSRYLATGEVPVINQRAPQYLDVSEGFDFVTMQHQVLEAQALFSELPSTLRERFGNNPALFIEYCADPANRPEMSKLGLLKTQAGPALPAGEAGQQASVSAPVAATSNQSSS